MFFISISTHVCPAALVSFIVVGYFARFVMIKFIMCLIVFTCRDKVDFKKTLLE
jgi:hypothetical protein